MRLRLSSWAPLLLVASTAWALPRPDARFRDGANHHEGDDSLGHAPTASDPEAVRMHAHLVYIREKLAAAPATSPALAKRRTELLGFLDDYIAKGVTPTNAHLPWRSPVFIDDDGAICAVGYLLERSVGRALPDRIAREHRYDYLEDIAATMPEVQSFIAGSGFTLDELASIQPAYSEPTVDTWVTWDLAEHPRPDGPYDDHGTEGAWKGGKMEGWWKMKNEAGKVVGKGHFARGKGTWTSFYADGGKLAEGPYRDNRADGTWRFFHPSGNLAAEGAFAHGDRSGRWHFFFDTPAKTPLAVGSFGKRGTVSGRWRHFDATGALIATSRTETPAWGDRDIKVNGGDGFTLTVVPAADGIQYAIHQGMVAPSGDDIQAETQRLETFAVGGERIYIHDPGETADETIYDDTGRKLVKDGTAWRAADCHWSKHREDIARSGDVARLHGLLFDDAARRARALAEDEYNVPPDPGPRCEAAQPVSATRARALDRLLARRDLVRAESPAFVKRAVLGDPDPDAPALDPDDDAEDIAYRKREERDASDLTRVLSRHMVMYIEWPHIDGRFIDVFATIPGRYSRSWVDGDPEEN